MAFQQGLSGLSAAGRALDAVSNNIANAATVGYKAAQAQFADVYAASLGIGGASEVGIGAAMTNVQQQFSQGNISNSNNPLDIAVNGSGFFRMQKSPTDQTITYTRNGQFHLDAQGYIVNAQGFNLTGYPIDNGVVNRAQLVPIQLDTSGVMPRATGASATNPGILTQINLDDRDLKSLASTTPNNLAPWSANTSFPPNNLNTFNYSTSVTVYDQKGNDHALSMYFTRIDNSAGVAPGKNQWQVHFVLDNQDITESVISGTSGQAGVPTIQFGADGQIVTDFSVKDEAITAAASNTLASPAKPGTVVITNAQGVPYPSSDYTLVTNASGAVTGFTLTAGSSITVGAPLLVDYTLADNDTVIEYGPTTVPMTIAKSISAGTDFAVTDKFTGESYIEGVDYTLTKDASGNVTAINIPASGSSITAGSTLLVSTPSAGVNLNASDFQFKIDVENLARRYSQFGQLFTTDIPINFDNSTLFGSGYDVNKLVQDGYPYGRLSGVSVSPEGVLRGNYSNGQTKDIAQMVLADFIAPTGLMSLGNNQWAETASSGQALIGDPGAGNRGLLQASAVEDANVDLTQELVNLITFQRNYQANAQSIKTQDQVMQTLVNLR